MTDHVPDTHQSVTATGPLALKSNLVLGPNALAYARACVSLLGAGEHMDTLNRALDEREELAVNLARADEENDKLRDEVSATLDALGDEVETSNNLWLIVESLGVAAAEALAILAEVKAWDCEAEQMLTLPIALRQRMQAALAAKNEATTHELHAAQEADELRALADSEGTRAVEYLRRARKAEAAVARFTPLRAKGVVDADDNLDCWDTNPYEICTRHVAALKEKDPAAMWRVVDLFARDEG